MEKHSLTRVLEFLRDNIIHQFELPGGRLIDLRRREIDGTHYPDFSDLVEEVSDLDLHYLASVLVADSDGILTEKQAYALLKRLGKLKMSSTERNNISILRRKYRKAGGIYSYLKFLDLV